jgi:CRISPR type IV-associated protein Csf2
VHDFRWEGRALAQSSIAHGGQTLGVTTYLRREKFLLPDGSIEAIPVVSGNALRGLLRRTGAKMLWEHLGQPLLPQPVVHALWSGGALTKAKGQPLTGNRLATLRRLVAHVGVFGAAGGGRIIDGGLQVGKMLPVCAQTAHLLPDALAAGPLPDMWNLLQVEDYTRLPNYAQHTQMLAGGVKADPTDALDALLAADGLADGLSTGEDLDGTAALETGPDGLMRYGVETLIAGTQFHVWLALSNATAAEHSYFTDVLARFSVQPFVGGRSARGHGQLSFDLTERRLDGDPAPEQWRDLGGGTITEALEALRWLD